MEKAATRQVLVVGSGGDDGSAWDGWEVVTLDIDPNAKPDILASMVDLGAIGPYEAVYCSHALEHLYPHEVPIALAEFHRVLAPGGMVMVVVPDLQDVAPTDEALPKMGLCGLDLFYGNSREVPGRPYMAHHCGFVADTLLRAMSSAGFKTKTMRMNNYNLMGIGTK
jgi:hypothetical protein